MKRKHIILSSKIITNILFLSMRTEIALIGKAALDLVLEAQVFLQIIVEKFVLMKIISIGITKISLK
ncbi:hypothetical protein RASY3_03140 [Ruminococcus albus SY3]|uniref:Uncharacterized protein n=1 Tax=Ruminococcus albus SY3 TaxID=1341156 RepID=A0A011VVR9_RUMAL|nr:hypothetical protein RASY3_18405 [Ruminococcus albus SY3]EXM41047.1 hypothetical protein RASY3_03140 [Ruminococcus albus SY3]